MSGLTAAQQLMAALRIDDSTSEVPSRRHPPLPCEPRLGPRAALATASAPARSSSTRAAHAAAQLESM